MLSQKNIEFEDMLKASNAALDDVKAQLKETETRLISVEQTNINLGQQLNLAELKCGDSDREIKELHDKVSELFNLLKASEEEHAISKCHLQAYQDRVSQLESSLDKSSSRKAELEKELADKCAEQESHSTAARDHNLELEELIRDTEAELKQKSNQLSEFSAEPEAIQVKSSSLEIAMDAANNKERELIDLLNAVTEEKKNFEDLFKNSDEKLLDAKNLLDVLQTELNLTEQKLQNVVSDLEASGIRERKILEQLKSAQEQLEHQGRAVENATARSLELESLHESLSKESEVKFQEAIDSFFYHISSLVEGKNLVHQKNQETRKEMKAVIIQMEEQTNEYWAKENSLNEQVESLIAELKVKSEMQEQIAELKQKLLSSEIQFTEEAFKM
ncbi:hypothetical protein Taro_020365 [Colocasia esculenta]|uniref:Uncharacterized protein n=1 Tax=Colocasia esculenta TaxID=4460 RepID=A0A843UW25_COLES|nr:hypothetical protein [Colocasia esculenta]